MNAHHDHSAQKCSHGHGGNSREAVATEFIDPVCGMTVKANSPHHASHDGHDHRFCSAGCRTKFMADPERYLVPADGGALLDFQPVWIHAVGGTMPTAVRPPSSYTEIRQGSIMFSAMSMPSTWCACPGLQTSSTRTSCGRSKPLPVRICLKS